MQNEIQETLDILKIKHIVIGDKVIVDPLDNSGKFTGKFLGIVKNSDHGFSVVVKNPYNSNLLWSGHVTCIEKENLMHEYKVGDFAHYNLRSDTKAVVVVNVSSNNKTVTVKHLKFKVKNFKSVADTYYFEDVEDIECTGKELVFKSRSNSRHNYNGDNYPVELHTGFASHMDPSK